MKKLLCVFICIVLLAGCEGSEEDENMFTDFYGFRTRIRATVNDTGIVADAEYDGVNGLTVTVDEPDSVKGMVVKIKDGECEIDFRELSFFFADDGLSPDSPLISLECLGESLGTAEKYDGRYRFVCREQVYYLYTTENTPVRMSTETRDILEFENFEFYGVQTR